MEEVQNMIEDMLLFFSKKRKATIKKGD